MSQSKSLLTDKAKARLKYLSTLVAGITALTYPVLVFLQTLGVVALGSVPEMWFYVYALLVTASFSYTLDVQLLKRISGVLDSGVGGAGGGQ